MTLKTLQRGQAMIETAVAMVALLPLFFLFLFAGKISSIQRTTIEASRAVAFECTVRLDCASSARLREITEEVRGRYFAANGGRIDSGRSAEHRDEVADRIALWDDRNGHALIESSDDVDVTVTPDNFDLMSNWATSALGRGVAGVATALASFASDGIGPSKFNLNMSGGLVKASVSSKVAKSNSARDFVGQLTSIPVQFSETTGILTDAWTASGPLNTNDGRSVRDRVEAGRRLLPGGRLGDYEAGAEDTYYRVFQVGLSPLVALGLEPYSPTIPSELINRRNIDLLPADVRP